MTDHPLSLSLSGKVYPAHIHIEEEREKERYYSRKHSLFSLNS